MFRNGFVIPSHTLLGMLLLIHVSKRGHRCLGERKIGLPRMTSKIVDSTSLGINVIQASHIHDNYLHSDWLWGSTAVLKCANIIEFWEGKDSKKCFFVGGQGSFVTNNQYHNYIWPWYASSHENSGYFYRSVLVSYLTVTYHGHSPCCKTRVYFEKWPIATTFSFNKNTTQSIAISIHFFVTIIQVCSLTTNA